MSYIRIQKRSLLVLCTVYGQKLAKHNPKHRLLVYNRKCKTFEERDAIRHTFFSTYGPRGINPSRPTDEDIVHALMEYYTALQAALAIEQARNWGKLS